MITPRPYQSSLREELTAVRSKGERRLLVVLSTGGGKMVIACDFIRTAVEKKKRVLFVSHRDEINRHAEETMLELGISVLEIARIQAGYRPNPVALVQIASIQTLRRRELPQADLLIIDEAHLALAPSYKRLFEAPLYKRSTFLLFTATPELGGKRLGSLVSTMIQGPLPSELVRNGFIAEPRVFSTPLPDLNHIPVDAKTGDFEQRALEQVVVDRGLMGSIVDEYLAHANGFRAIGFAVSVKHAEALMTRFVSAGIRSAVVTGATPTTVRQRMFSELKSGELEVLWSVGVLVEGFDCPSVKCGIWARPTRSLTVYLQGTGRILRPWHPDYRAPVDGPSLTPVLLDHAGNVDRLGMPCLDREWTLEDKPKKKSQLAPPATKGCPLCLHECAASCRACPECGHEFTEQVTLEEDGSVHLVERTTEERGAAMWMASWKLAKYKGYKPGWVDIQFQREFSMRAPRLWRHKLYEAYENDSEWKGKVIVKERVFAKRRREAQA